MKSMTGYGKATLAINSREYQIELRSVNHRYLDINVRMPKTLSFLEDDIKKEISKEIKRGKIDVIVTFINNNVETKDIKINTDIARIYINEFKKIAKEEQISSNIEITEISKLPDVLVIEDKENEEELRKVILKRHHRYSDNEKFTRYLIGKGYRYDQVKEALSELSEEDVS